MAKPKKRPKKKGPSILAQMAKEFWRIFDGSAEFVAKHTGPKAANQRRASLEWTSKAQGNGERLPLQPRDVTWNHQTQKDKEIWRVTFMDGYVTTFVTWPPRDHVEAVKLAKEHVEKLYGAYTLSWEVATVERVGMAVEDELTEDAKA
jgi:hypothetical protein